MTDVIIRSLECFLRSRSENTDLLTKLPTRVFLYIF